MLILINLSRDFKEGKYEVIKHTMLILIKKYFRTMAELESVIKHTMLILIVRKQNELKQLGLL